MCNVRHCARAGLACLLGAFSGTAAVSADVLVPEALDQNATRSPMPGEGLLEQLPNPFAAGGARYGGEYTGWVDVRSPALAGPTSTIFGYDRYDRRIDQATTVLTDNAGVVATADVTRDLNHANRAYASQAGVSVIERSTRGYTSPAVGQANSFNFPLSHGLGPAQMGQPAEEQGIMQQNVAGNRVNVYYGRDLTSGAYGETFNPSLIAGGNNEAVFMAQRVSNGAGGFIPITRNTHAHELTHFMTDGMALHQPIAADPSHSSDPRNLIGSPQYDPGQVAGAPWAIPDNDTVAGPSMSQAAGGAPKVGGISQLRKAQLYSNIGGANPDQGMFGSNASGPYLSTGENLAAADKVDWNFAVDDWVTEDVLGGADNHPGGRESLYFSSGNPTVSADPAATADNGGKSKTGLGTFNNPGYHQGTFRYADVFSIVARYADYDVNNTGDDSLRASALDYDVTFVLPGNVLVPGVPVTVFTEGWSDQSVADDWLARWQSPSDAIGVLVTAHRYTDLVNGENIGNAQIDAVIVSSEVPEPGTLSLFALGCLAAIARQGRQRR
jgi:hypothetical protein